MRFIISLFLLVFLTSGCAKHRHDLLEGYKDLDLYKDGEFFHAKPCNREMGSYVGWPNALREPKNGDYFVHGLLRSEHVYTFWRCEVLAFKQIGAVYGFMRGEPVYTAQDEKGYYLVWGAQKTKPLGAIGFSWMISEHLGVPVYIAEKDGKGWVGYGLQLQGPFDKILQGPVLDSETGEVKLLVQVDDVVMELSIRKARFKETEPNLRMLKKTEGI